MMMRRGFVVFDLVVLLNLLCFQGCCAFDDADALLLGVDQDEQPQHQYKFMGEKAGWFEAQLKCMEWGGNLATVNSAQENELLVQNQAWQGLKKPNRGKNGDVKLKGKFAIWLGSNDVNGVENRARPGEDVDDTTRFTWTTGEAVSFTNFRKHPHKFHKSEPNNGWFLVGSGDKKEWKFKGEEHCLAMIGSEVNSKWEGKWLDAQCSEKRVFICEKQATSGASTSAPTLISNEVQITSTPSFEGETLAPTPTPTLAPTASPSETICTDLDDQVKSVCESFEQCLWTRSIYSTRDACFYKQQVLTMWPCVNHFYKNHCQESTNCTWTRSYHEAKSACFHQPSILQEWECSNHTSRILCQLSPRCTWALHADDDKKWKCHARIEDWNCRDYGDRSTCQQNAGERCVWTKNAFTETTGCFDKEEILRAWNCLEISRSDFCKESQASCTWTRESPESQAKCFSNEVIENDWPCSSFTEFGLCRDNVQGKPQPRASDLNVLVIPRDRNANCSSYEIEVSENMISLLLPSGCDVSVSVNNTVPPVEPTLCASPHCEIELPQQDPCIWTRQTNATRTTCFAKSTVDTWSCSMHTSSSLCRANPDCIWTRPSPSSPAACYSK